MAKLYQQARAILAAACLLAAIVAPPPSAAQQPSYEADAFLRDDFSSESSGWPTVGDGGASSGYSAGAYRLRVSEGGRTHVALGPVSTRDVSLRVETRSTVFDGGAFGLVFAASADQQALYALAFQPTSSATMRVSFRKRIDGGWVQVTPWKGTYVNAGSASTGAIRLEVIREGSSMHGYVNGRLHVSAVDSELGDGRVGFLADTSVGGTVVDVELDDFVAAPSPAFNLRWSAGPTLPQPSSGHAAAAVGGKIYVVGGGSALSNPAPAATLQYDPASDQWTPRRDPPTLRSGVEVVATGDRIYVVGGSPLSGTYRRLGTVEVYHPAADLWTTGSALPVPRWGFAVAAPGNGKVYAIGGHDENSNQVLDLVHEYDPASNHWTQRSSLPLPLGRTAAAAIGGKIYVVGGFADGNNPARDFYEYDPATDRWASYPGMPARRNQVDAVVGENGNIYTIDNGGDGDEHPLVYELDPRTRRWSPMSDLLLERNGFAAVSLNGLLYVLGGVKSTQMTATGEVTRLPLRVREPLPPVTGPFHTFLPLADRRSN